MSDYTTTLRYICESYAGETESQGYDKVDEIINKSRRMIFGDYPIFDEDYREVLETKIIKHFYMREICAETVGLWKMWLNNTMNEIMPVYNKLYETERIKFDPFIDVDYTIEHSRNTAMTNESNSKSQLVNNDSEISNKENNGTSHNVNRYSDTPQGGLNGMTSVENNMYLTNATLDDDTNSSKENRARMASRNEDRDLTNKGTESSLMNYVTRKVGKQGFDNYSEMIMNYRKSFINIDKMIITELESLFFMLW